MRRSALIFCAALVAAFCSVLPAAATDFSFRSCSQDPAAGATATGKGWWAYPVVQSTAPGSPKGACPAGMSFGTAQNAVAGATGYWGFDFNALESAIHLSFGYSGAETTGGWRYTVSSCASTCTTLATLPERTAEALPATFDLDIASVPQLRIVATCQPGGCTPSVPLTFHDVVLTVRDVSPPKASVTFNSSYWSDPRDVRASVTVSDPYGVGLSEAVARVDGRTGFFGRNACTVGSLFPGTTYFPSDALCELSISQPSQQLALDGVPDGVHNVEVDSVDAAGNVMTTKKAPFKIDGTPPSTPEDPVLSGVNEHGWTQDDHIGATWTNAGEEAETTLQSGIWLPRHQRKPFPGFSVDTATVEGIFDVDTAKSIKSIALPTDGKWNLYISVKDRAGNESGAVKVPVGRDNGKPAAPVLEQSGWMNQGALNAFEQGLTQPVGEEISGICGYGVSIDVDPGAAAPSEVTQPSPLSGLAVGAGLPDGVNWLHARAVSCADIASDSATTAIKVDRAPPVVAIDGVPSTGWTNKPVTAKGSATDQLSGVATIASAIDDQQLVGVDGASSDLTAPLGKHTLRFLATDHAGNPSTEIVREVWFDDELPDLRVDAFDPTDPTRLSGAASDRLSGLAMAVFEYRRAGDGAWQPLPTTSSSADASVAAVIPDEALDPGEYEFRLRAGDMAGNGAVAAAGTRALPLRSQPRVSVRLAKVTGTGMIDRSGAKSARTVGFGRPIALVGELRDQDGRPIAGANLKVFSAAGGMGRELLTEITTDSRGGFTFKPRKGPSRRFTLSYAGARGRLPAAGTADLGVTVGAELRVSQRVVRVGRWVRFSGYLRGTTAAHSAKGLRVTLEFFNPGNGWQTGVGSSFVDANGRFVVKYKFKVPTRVVRVRAFVNTRRTSFPYVEGYTNEVRVRARR